MKRYGYLSLIAFGLFIGALLLGFQVTASKNSENDQIRIEENIVQATITCYSIEGFYPKQLSYLETNYHLRLDTNRYQVHYEWIANNIRPDIFVFAKGDE